MVNILPGWTETLIQNQFCVQIQNLLRDVGQGNIGLGMVALTALLIGGVWLARVAGMAIVVANVPHQIYHQDHLDILPTVGEQVLQTATLSFVSLTAIVLTVLAFRLPDGGPAGAEPAPVARGAR